MEWGSEIWPDVRLAEILLVCAVSFVAGVVRGFSGFGSALMMVPVMAAVFDPRVAIPAATAVHLITSIQLIPEAVRDCDWGRVVPLSVAGCIAIPLGAWFLVTQDPGLLRRIIAILVIVFAVLMLRGWRYHGRTRGWQMAVAGSVGGLITGAATIGGPPVVIFLMAGPYRASENRAAIMLYFMFVQSTAMIMYWIGGILVWQVVGVTLLVTPALMIGTFIGQRMFRHASEEGFRRFALGFLLVIGVVTLFV